MDDDAVSTPTRWAHAPWMPALLLPAAWANEVGPPSERGPFQTIYCSDLATAEQVLAAMNRESNAEDPGYLAGG